MKIKEAMNYFGAFEIPSSMQWLTLQKQIRKIIERARNASHEKGELSSNIAFTLNTG